MSLLQEQDEYVRYLNKKYGRSDISELLDKYCDNIAKLPQNEVANYVLEADKERYEKQQDDIGNSVNYVLNIGHIFTGIMNDSKQFSKFEKWLQDNHYIKTNLNVLENDIKEEKNMSEITENTIIIDKERVAELKEFLLERRFAHDSIKEIYQDPYGKCLLTFDYNGSPTEDDDWPFKNILIETDYGEDDLWTRNDNGDIDDTIQSQIQKGILFPELHNNNELFNKVMHNLEYNIGGLHGNDLYNLKSINNLLDNLTKQQKELLLSAVNEFDEGQVSDYKSFNALKEDIENNILHIAYTTAGDDEEYEIQVDFDFSTMCYKQYVDNELIVTDSRIDRDFYSFCEELRICRFDEMISDCVDSINQDTYLENAKEDFKVLENDIKEEKNMSETKQYRLYFTDSQLKNMKEMPVKEQNEKGEWVQQIDPLGSPVTETRCIVDIPDTAFYITKAGKKMDLSGYNLVMRNQFFRSEHDNGFYCIIDSDKKYRLDKVEPIKDENGQVRKTPEGKTMFDFDSTKSLFVKGKQLKVMMDSWKNKEKVVEKKPLNLGEYKEKASAYNQSKEKDEIHKVNDKER